MRKPLKRKSYVVGLLVDGDVVEHVVEISPADQLRGETEGRRYGLGSMGEAPLSYTTLWCYLALVRTGVYAGKWQQFTQVDLYDFEPLDEEPVDPTKADTSASASPSPSTSETPGSG